MLESSLIQQLLVMKDEKIESIKESLVKVISTQGDLYTLMLTAFVIFLKENQLGQSVYTQYVEETKCPIDQSGPLPDLDFDPISWKNAPLQSVLVEYFSRESEHFYQRTQFLILFLVLELTTQQLVDQNHAEGLLWQARFASIHNSILTSNVEQLQTLILGNYSKFIEKYK